MCIFCMYEIVICNRLPSLSIWLFISLKLDCPLNVLFSLFAFELCCFLLYCLFISQLFYLITLYLYLYSGLLEEEKARFLESRSATGQRLRPVSFWGKQNHLKVSAWMSFVKLVKPFVMFLLCLQSFYFGRRQKFSLPVGTNSQ